MKNKFTIFLERILKNKIFFILIAISLGIGVRFSTSNNTIFIIIISWFCTYSIYKITLWQYNAFLVKQDLLIISGQSRSKFYHLQHNIYLFLVIVTMMFVYLFFGFSAASFRFYIMNPKEKLLEQIDEIYIVGQVKQFERKEKGIRVYLSNVYESNKFQDLNGKLHLGTIRIHLRQKIESENIIGEWIFLKVTLMPPPQPAFPQSFDFSQYAFFKGIGAIGYGLQKPILIAPVVQQNFSILNYIEHSLNILRKNITLRIKNSIPEPAAGITAAILVGENSQINSEDYYALRVAGLAHIIAISGMHVVVVVAIAFFFVCAILLYLLPILTGYQFALHFSVSKAAAIISIFLSTFYVFLAGAPVSAQRALITSSIVMLCIVYDKNIHPTRSLCLVAIIMLILTPEVLFSPGLQMSFAACFALIATFEILDKSFRFKFKYISYFVKLGIASLAASAATAPFIIYHFQQFAPYGVFANLVCVPLSDFIIMPFGMLSMLLMPFGLEKFSLIPVQYSIDFMLWIAHKISNLPHADIHTAAFSPEGIITIAVGLFVLCVSHSKYIRSCGLVLMILGCFMVEKYDDIILIVSQKTFAIRYDQISQTNDTRFVLSSRQKDRFAHEVWQSKLGENNFINESLSTLAKKNKTINCNSSLCITNTIIVLQSEFTDYIQELCEKQKPKFFINLYNNKKCDAAIENIVKFNLRKHGVYIIRNRNNILVSSTVN